MEETNEKAVRPCALIALPRGGWLGGWGRCLNRALAVDVGAELVA